jgi:hypothetical protein
MLRQLDTVYKDSANLDAFGRLRVTQIETLFDSKSLFSKRPAFWDEAITATGTSTFDADRSTIELAVAASGDKVIRQTKEFFNYQPGKSQVAFISFNDYGHEANTLKRVGIFYENDGIFFEDDGVDYKIVLRTSTSGAPDDTNAIAQASWNLDTMDGNGISGITIDFTKTQILTIDYEWLGVGRVRCGFVINGKTYYFHEFLNANVNVDVYMATPNLPIRYEIEATGVVVGTPKIDAICSTVITENGNKPHGVIFSISNASTGLSVTASTQESLIQLRLRTDRIRKGTIEPLNMSVLTTTGANFMWSIRINPTVAGGAASWQNVGDDSVAEYDVSQNGTVSNDGILIASGYASTFMSSTQQEINTALHAAADIAGTADIVVLSVLNLGVGAETFFGSLIWREWL